MIQSIILSFFLLFQSLTAHETPPKKTVCLNMIVKNESQVITRGLDSAKPLINYWVIVDTGSTDGTQAVIKECLKDIPGELHERPWVNFAHNRNEALALAKGKADYVLILDADDQYVLDQGFALPPLAEDAYHISIQDNGSKYSRLQLIKNDIGWKWVGVVHEVLVGSEAKSYGTLEGITYLRSAGGDRSRDPKKYHKDAALLEAALAENPTNARDQFYLAQSYRDAGEYELALKNYQKRVDLGGWEEEVFFSLFQIARLQEILKRPHETIVAGYYAAYHYRPSRMEPLYHLARYYRMRGDFELGYLVSQTALGVPMSADLLFVEKWAYDYDLLLENTICAYWIGRYEECRDGSLKLLLGLKTPTNVTECVTKNLAFANQKIVQKLQGQAKAIP